MVLFCMCGQLPAQLLFLDCFLPVHFLPLVPSSYVLKYKSPVSKDRHLKMYFSICVRICSEVNMVGARFWDDSHFSWLFSPRGLWHLVCNSMLTSFPLVWFHIRAQASECEKKKRKSQPLSAILMSLGLDSSAEDDWILPGYSNKSNCNQQQWSSMWKIDQFSRKAVFFLSTSVQILTLQTFDTKLL